MYRIVITSKTVHGLRAQLQDLACDLDNATVEVKEREPISEIKVTEKSKVELPVDISDLAEEATTTPVVEAPKKRTRKLKSSKQLIEAIANQPAPEIPLEAPPVVEVLEAWKAIAPVETPVVEAAPVVEAPLDSYDLASFKKNLLSIITNLINQGKIDRDYIKSINDYFQIKSIWEVTKDELKVTQLFEQFVAYGFVNRVG